jgi:hypothetical protein
MISRRIPLGESLQRFWRHLVPVSTIAPIGLLIFLFFPRWMLLIMLLYFYAACYYALLPQRSHGATFLFWLLAMALYMNRCDPGHFHSLFHPLVL